MVATKAKANRDMCKSQHTKESKYTVRVKLYSEAKNDYQYKAISALMKEDMYQRGW